MDYRTYCKRKESKEERNIMDYSKQFENYEVPENLKRIASAIMERFVIDGICDGMYICNVIAVENGLGDGNGFFVNGDVIYPEKTARRLQFSYGHNIRKQDIDELVGILKTGRLDRKLSINGLNKLIRDMKEEQQKGDLLRFPYLERSIDEAKKTLAKLNSETESDSEATELTVRVPGGVIKATKCTDPNYPGIDVEYVPDDPDDPDKNETEFRMLMEYADRNIHGHVWSNPKEEDPTRTFVIRTSKKVVGECKLLENGEYEIEREAYQQGYIFKDWEAFEKGEGPCYVPELSDSVYTKQNFLDMCNGQEDVDKYIFEAVDWQSPGTYLDEALRNEELKRCESCGRIFWTDEGCPYCTKSK